MRLRASVGRPGDEVRGKTEAKDAVKMLDVEKKGEEQREKEKSVHSSDPSFIDTTDVLFS